MKKMEKMKKIITAAVAALSLIFGVFPVFAVPYSSYEWGNLPVGGQGFITGIIPHPKVKDLIYIRTDVGGAYRWEAETETWIQLMDGFGREDSNFFGIDGMAVSTQNVDVVYAAAGKNTSGSSDVLKSVDRGQTWIRTGLNKTFRANGTGYRGYGECLGVDPVNDSIVYAGTYQSGLWRSFDGALTWEQATQVDCLTNGTNSVRNIIFDESTAASGMSQTIYAGVTSKGIYRSQDGGESWELLPGSPLTSERMDITSAGILYVASTRGLFRFENEKFTEISPAGQEGREITAVDVDINDDSHIVMVGYSTNRMRLPMFRSTDGGQTWTNIWNTVRYQTTLPWRQMIGDFSSNTHDIKIDPFNPGKIMLGDFHGVYWTEDISEEPTQLWTDPAKGLEEVVPRDGISMPEGKYRLMAAIADIDALPYEDITKYPTRMIREKRQVDGEPWMMGTSQIDYCEESPNYILRVGIDWNTNGKIEYTDDGSETWNNVLDIPYYYDANGKKLNAIPYGKAAVSAQLNPETGLPVIVTVPAYNPNNDRKLAEGAKTVPLVSFDLGATWEESKGFPEGTNVMDDYWDKYYPISSDKVAGNKFYIFTKNYVYVSEDWGRTYTQAFQIDGDENTIYINAAPGMEGEVWASKGAAGLWRSSDSGKTFKKVSAVNSCVSFGFGKSAPDYDNPALYVFGEIDGLEALYRSVDMGDTWERISGEKNSKLGDMPGVIVGDSRTFGLVYVGSDGRGFYVGMPMGTKLETESGENAGAGYGEYKIRRNGKELAFANRPFMLNEILMVPAREFYNYMDAEVIWRPETNSADIIRKKLNVKYLGIYAGGEVFEQTATFAEGNYILVNDETMYIPIAEAASALDASLTVDETGALFAVEDKALIMYD
jgi:photosystem II stability/assembly factor-like uncharacterized protein